MGCALLCAARFPLLNVMVMVMVMLMVMVMVILMVMVIMMVMVMPTACSSRVSFPAFSCFCLF